MNNTKPLLTVNDLSFSYQRDLFVLHNLNFSCNSGELFVIAGPNGSGKTTLIKLIFDLLNMQNGSIKIGEENHETLAAKKRILYLPSEDLLPRFLTGNEYIRLLCKMYDCPFNDSLYEKLLVYYSMQDSIHKLIESYSHGMAKKIQLIAAFLIQTDITIVDETLNGIDIKAKEVSKVLLKKLVAKNKLVLLCTHELELAQEIADQALLLYHGDLCANVNMKESTKSLTDMFKEMISFEEKNYEI